jgi:hypothetical protein
MKKRSRPLLKVTKREARGKYRGRALRLAPECSIIITVQGRELCVTNNSDSSVYLST